MQFSLVYSEKKILERFYFEPQKTIFIRPGWNLIKIPDVGKIKNAYLICDLGQGFNDDHNKFSLNCFKDKITSSVLALPDGIRNVRIVFRGHGSLNNSLNVQFIPISRISAFIRIGLYFYRLSRLRKTSVFRFFREKWNQVQRVGVIQIFKNLDYYYDYGDSNSPSGYQQWIAEKEISETITTQNGVFSDSGQFNKKIMVFVKLSEIKKLEKTVISLRAQSYSYWQLVVIDETDKKYCISKELNQLLLSDERVVVFRSSLFLFSLYDSFVDCCIDKKINYLMLMQEGDTLAPNALYSFLLAAEKNDAALLYCDSDFFDEYGKRFKPFFRPAWNKELFYSQNYIANCCIVRINILPKSSNEEFFSQLYIYKIILCLIESKEDDKILHVPKILYHANSFNSDTDFQDNNIYNLQRIELKKHFQRMGYKYFVRPGILFYTHKIVYPLPKNLPRVTIVIPTRDQARILKKCVKSVIKWTSYSEYDILIVNNCSVDADTLKYFGQLKKSANVRVVDYDKSFNFSAINNFAVQQTKSDFICLLNNDTEVFSGKWLEEMVRIGCRQEVGSVGAKLLYGDRSVQHAGIICGIGNVADHAHRFFKRDAAGYMGRLQSVQYFSALTAACLLVRRDVYRKVGGMNEQLAVDFNDVDFCLRLIKAGYKNVYTPYAELYHHESISRRNEDRTLKDETFKKAVTFMRETWGKEIKHDPCYNPNLSRVHNDFSI